MDNKIYLALDVSTTNVGIATFTQSGELYDLRHLKLKNDKDHIDFERLIHKANTFSEYFEELKNVFHLKNLEVVDIYIEEPLLASNDQQTAIKLQKFNGICSYTIYKLFNIIPKLISVHESRKLFCPELVNRKIKKGEIVETLSFPQEYINDKKLYIWRKVAEKEKTIEWFYTKNNTLKPESFDMSDAYCVGKSSLLKYGIIKN